MNRVPFVFSPLTSPSIVCHRTVLFTKLKPRQCWSARHSTLSSIPLARAPRAFQPPPAALREQSVWRFVASRISQATHRSGITNRGSRGHGGNGGDPQGPWQRLRARINAIPSGVIFWGIIGLNALVFVSWNVARAQYQATGDGSSYVFMLNNFISSAENLRSGRWWTLLTCCFSHEDTTHLLFNGFTFYFMAPFVLSILGNVGFLGLYLGGGIVSSLAGIAWRDYKKPPVHATGSHGASGAIYSVVSFFACVAPTATFALFGIIPVPAWALVTGIFLWDGYSAMNQKRVGTDTAGHIGGLLAGIGYYVAKRLRLF
ncbi:hypothetical protein BD414DRAFT_574685 [Trametes punicea]|nr:hypothetical protein BD414DRAFT_574685 [Trametes punicea]